MDNAKRLVVSCQLWYWYRSWMMLGSEAGRGGERREEEDERIVGTIVGDCRRRLIGLGG